mmetsp:Transcript_18986/g.64402  ORF Transcript_18986/g.64402 Transcript_18986/m.64402 type:complete len:699 (-) Transcript_18986:775-2871(-)
MRRPRARDNALSTTNPGRPALPLASLLHDNHRGLARRAGLELLAVGPRGSAGGRRVGGVHHLNAPHPEHGAEVVHVRLHHVALVVRQVLLEGLGSAVVGLVAHEGGELHRGLEHGPERVVRAEVLLEARHEVRGQRPVALGLQLRELAQHGHLPLLVGRRDVHAERRGGARGRAHLAHGDARGLDHLAEEVERAPRGLVRLPGRGPRRPPHAALTAEHLAPYALGEVRAHGRDEERLHLNEAPHEPAVHGHARALAPVAVQVPRELHLEPARLERVAEVHERVVAVRLVHEEVHLVGEHAVHVRVLGLGRIAEGDLPGHDAPNPHVLLVQGQHGAVGHVLLKVGVVERVPRVRQAEPRRVRGVHLAALQHHEEVSLLLGHLLAVDHDVAVGVHAAGPHLGAVLPDGRVVVQAHGQVVGDEVLGRNAQVHGVPVLELALEHRQLLLRNAAARLGRERPAEEHVVEARVRQLGRFHAQGPRALAHNVALALEEVRDGVVGHVDGGVRERLDDPLVVPRQLRAEAEHARAGPLPEPAQRADKVLERLAAVGVEPRAADVAQGALAPRLLAVGDVPLVRHGHDALIAAAAHHLGLGLEVRQGRALGDHGRADERLGHLDARALVLPDDHDALVEALEVHLLLGRLELVGVPAAPDLVLLHHELRAAVPVAGDVDDGHHVEGLDHVGGDVVLGAELGLVLELH